MSDLALSIGRNGFRLESMELYNWGTFGRVVWSFPFGCENALVTGDIGSGKSTWVDALTTLLVPPQRITYNKAAGAERRERTDKSYLLGEYRSSRAEGTAYSAPVNLRDESCYSVLVAVFADQGGSRLLSLAQLRWLKGGEVQRIYVTSGRRLKVLADFADFSGDGPSMRKRLRLAPSTEVFDSYADYAASFRSSMGIGEKALDLFNQTLSMKTIGDLDDFIRDHMLEATGARERLDRILRNFDNLRAAHDAVEGARRQRDTLLPIAAEAQSHLELASSIEDLKNMAQAMPYRAIALEIPLLEKELQRIDLELEGCTAEREILRGRKTTAEETKASLRSAIDNSAAGRRIREIEAELLRVADERERRRLAAERYGTALESLGYAFPSTAEGFVALCASLETEGPRLSAEGERLSANRDACLFELRALSSDVEAIESELASLKARTTSIPAKEVTKRRAMAEAVGATEKELPFVGELLRVREEERKWEGAAERVMRSFALSILVPERHYRAVCDYVRGTPLDARVVYYRVPEKTEEIPRLSEKSLARVLEVKQDSPFRPWLELEISRRAPHARCEEMERFYREPDAVTQEGLVKSGKTRHEKDDRRVVADPRNFILGWSNTEKITLLERDVVQIRESRAKAEHALAKANLALESLESRRNALVEAMRPESFDTIDVADAAKRHRGLRAEKEAIEASDDRLESLKAAFSKAEADLSLIEGSIEGINRRAGALENEQRRREEELGLARRNAESSSADAAKAWFDKIDAFVDNTFPALGGFRDWQSGVTQRLETRRGSQERKDREVRESLQRRMHEFLTSFPDRKSELMVGVDFASDYKALLGRIERDDLPSCEGRFRKLLRESTLQDIALFQAELENDARAIKEAIEVINRSLVDIEYNPGTFICLAAERRDDRSVRDFRAELRRCLESSLGDDDIYSEDKFLKVKALLTRLGGPDLADRSWTEHVIDARSWFTFIASERWKEDGTEKEFYSSSSGKSGGQKEKLAYTILASALAYQYAQGAKSSQGSSGGFRLVVIDEAFGRGSEESTRYGLRLFSSLDLQLVLVTPLQKIGIIEGSVATIHFIANPGGAASEVRSLGIKEYEEGKMAAAKRAQ
jgi:uncharacterized protein YPO0396